MYQNLPNLELLEYQCKQLLQENEEWKEKWNKLSEEKGRLFFHLDCTMFSQWWGSTATAFNGIGGQAMTKAYTVVFHEENTDMYAVFIDNKPCYLITKPNDNFYTDLKEHKLVSLKEAETRY